MIRANTKRVTDLVLEDFHAQIARVQRRGRAAARVHGGFGSGTWSPWPTRSSAAPSGPCASPSPASGPWSTTYRADLRRVRRAQSPAPSAARWRETSSPSLRGSSPASRRGINVVMNYTGRTRPTASSDRQSRCAQQRGCLPGPPDHRPPGQHPERAAPRPRGGPPRDRPLPAARGGGRPQGSGAGPRDGRGLGQHLACRWRQGRGGRPLHLHLLLVRRTGARAVNDGLSATAFPAGCSHAGRGHESLAPLLFLSARRSGTARGARPVPGLPRAVIASVCRRRALCVLGVCDRTRIPARGFGGEPGAPGEV